MKSTGEILGQDVDYPRALYKALLAAGIRHSGAKRRAARHHRRGRQGRGAADLA
jgi:hypothetical protein